MDNKAMRFSSTMPLSLPIDFTEISDYAMNSVLSQRELQIRKRKEKKLSRVMTEIRLASKREFTSTPASTNIKGLCNDALQLSEDLRDEEKKCEVLGIMRNLALDTSV
jgi:hypothetical protein